MAAPVLWHIRISHYNEKVRWALEYKRVAHVRRAPLPGFHPVVARAISGAPTLPILVIDGQAYSDSTRIIAEIERRWPEPPLYASDAAERTRALALEDEFDERLGPEIRRLIFQLIFSDPALAGTILTGPDDERRARVMSATFAFARPFVAHYYGVSADRVADARRSLERALDRVQEEVGPSGYLVGDSFSVADLTAASLLAPIVRPPQFAGRAERFTPEAEALAAELEAHPTFDWVRMMFERHRLAAAPDPVAA
jgi:glutathione S-transferase